MQDTLNHLGGIFLSFAWSMLWQSSLLIAVIFMADLLLAKKLRASVRHALWLMVLVKLLMPPTLALPTSAAWWLFPAKPIVEPANIPVAKLSAVNTSVVVFDDGPPPDFVEEPIPQIEPPHPKLDRAGWILVATGAVSVGLLFWLLLRWWQLSQKVRRATKVSGATAGGNLETLLGQAKQLARLRGAIRLKLVDSKMSPAVCGLFRPVILLPRALVENLSAPQLRAVLLHEMIHLRRRDIWVNCVQSLLQIAYWWHPLVWLTNARIRRVREEAVDDAVMLGLASDADTYAPTLLEVAKLAFQRPLMSLGIIGLISIIESRSALRQRVERLVDFQTPRKAGLTFLSFCAIFMFSAVALPMGQGPAPIVHAQPPESRSSAPAPVQPPPPSADVQPRLPTVLINALIYHIPPQALDKIVTSLDLHPADTNGDAWWSASPEEYTKLQSDLTNSSFAPVNRPRIQTSSGNEADFFVGFSVGNNAYGTELRCTPKVNDNQVNLDLRGKITDHPAAPVTNQFAVKALSLNHGGVVVRFPDDTNNTVVFLNVEIKPAHHSTSSGVRPDPNFRTVLHALQQRTGVETLGEPEATVIPLRKENRAEIYSPRGALSTVSGNPGKNFQNEAGSTGHIAKPRFGPVPSGAPPDGAAERIHGPSTPQNTGTISSTPTNKFPPGTDSSPIPPSGFATDFGNNPTNDATISPKLFVRIFRVDSSAFSNMLENATAQAGLGTNAPVSTMAKAFFNQLGVNLKSPPGKSVFYNTRLGVLLVKATRDDLDTIEHALQVLNQTPPQIHIKARFFEVPKGTLDNFNSTLNAVTARPISLTGILTSQNAALALRALESAKGVETLGEPEATVISGRRLRMSQTGVQTIVTNLSFSDSFTNKDGTIVSGTIEPQTSTLEIGPILDARGTVLDDGYTIDLSARATLNNFFGYAEIPPKLSKSVTNALGQAIDVPLVWPAAQTRSQFEHVNLYDNETLVFSMDQSQAKPIQYSASDDKRDTTVAAHIHDAVNKDGEKQIVVFITSTIINTVGNRVHSDKDMSSMLDRIPPQPPATTNDDSALFGQADSNKPQPHPIIRRKAQSENHLASASAPLSTTLDDLIKDGKVFYEMGKFNEARDKLNAALAIDPSNATAKYYLNLINNQQTDAEANLKSAPPSGATKNLVWSGPGRQAIIAKLDKIRLDKVSYDSLPLKEVLKQLSEQIRLRDPEHIGINFLINNNPALSGQPNSHPDIDPTTGLPVAPISSTATTNNPIDAGSFLIKIPNLQDFRLADVLDALTLVSDHPLKYSIQDFAVVFSPKGPDTPQLFMRTFRVDPNMFYQGLENLDPHSLPTVKSIQFNLKTADGLTYITTQTSAATPSALARAFFTTLGVNLLNPPGKSVFFNDRLSYLFVKATEDDLDTIGRALGALNQTPPQVHIKARFIAVPKGTAKDLVGISHSTPSTSTSDSSTGVLTDPNFRVALQSLRANKDAQTLGEPEVTVISGRQVEMRTTETLPGANSVEVGTTLDLVPYVLADGYTINLAVIPTYFEHDEHNPAPAPGSKLPLDSPKFADRQLVSTVNLGDNQTCVLIYSSTGRNKTSATGLKDQDLITFVTATIVDPAGSRVHSDDELPFTQTQVPAQPATESATTVLRGRQTPARFSTTIPNTDPSFLTPVARENEHVLMSQTLHAQSEPPPDIHIKTRFISVPKGTLAGLTKYLNATNHNDGKPMGILSANDKTAILRLLGAQKGVMTLGEPEVTMLNGRQSQMRATEMDSVITNLAWSEQSAVVAQTSPTELGSVLDVVPSALPDGFSIHLAATPSITEFAGYDVKPEGPLHIYKTGEKLPTITPKFQIQQFVASANVWDGQTLLLTMEEHPPLKPAFTPDAALSTVTPNTSNVETNDLLVLVTPTLVDSTGTPIYSATDLLALPPLPPQPN